MKCLKNTINDKELLNTEIKTLIQKYPVVGEVLRRYNLICAVCSIGICRLSEIVKIYGLSPEKSNELISQIREAIYSPKAMIEEPTWKSQYEASPSLKIVVEKFQWIKTLLNLMPSFMRVLVLHSILTLSTKFDLEKRLYRPLAKRLVKHDEVP